MTADYGQAVEFDHAWVAKYGERVVGLLVLWPANDHLLLENVAVLPQAQGLGVGQPAATARRRTGSNAGPARDPPVHERGDD